MITESSFVVFQKFLLIACFAEKLRFDEKDDYVVKSERGGLAPKGADPPQVNSKCSYEGWRYAAGAVQASDT